MPLLAVLLLALGGAPGQEIYFVRHGETVANATGRYNGSTLNKLSAAGEAQVQAVAKALAQVHFDAAIVSPSLRAQLTAAPTLRELRLTAVVWPEFNECCTEHGAARLKPPSPRLRFGGKASIPASLAEILRLDPADNRLFAPADYADGIAQTRLAASHVRRLLADSRLHRILIVGHSAQGSRFLDLMLGRKPIGDIEIKNGGIYVLREQPGGTFKLVSKIENPVKSARVDPRMR